jgi:hypothetical protein
MAIANYVQRIVGCFSEATGHKQLSSSEWQRIGHQIRLLVKKGYTEQDIINAIEYAKVNVKNFYGFGMVGCVIDKAKESRVSLPSKPTVTVTQPKSLLDEYGDQGVVRQTIPSTSKPKWMESQMEVG